MGDPFALALVQAAPNADRLIDRKGVIEAGTPNHARGADRFCLELALETFVTVLRTLWRKEDLRMGTATGRSYATMLAPSNSRRHPSRTPPHVLHRPLERDAIATHNLPTSGSSGVLTTAERH
jgi:hypothetical protein